MLKITNKYFSDATTWEVPTVRAGDLEKDAQEVIFAISNGSVATPEDFDALLLERYPDYDLRRGGRCGWTVLAAAIAREALPLIHHILNKVPELLNGGWDNSNTPYIVSATINLDIFMEFVNRGAEINLASPAGTTALAAAASDRTKTKVTQYLLKNGGVIYNLHRNAILEHDRTCEKYKQSYRDQPKNILAAMDIPTAAHMFLNGNLCRRETADRRHLTSLPYDIRERIWSHLTEVETPLLLEDRKELWPRLNNSPKPAIPLGESTTAS